MAVDEYLFRSLVENPATYLRFYMWKEPTVSFGYSQRADKVLDIEFCRENRIEIVRRMTGGKLVLHHKEVTYSLCSSDAGTFTANLADSYKLISEGLICGLEKMGLNAHLAQPAPKAYIRGNLPCFSYPSQNEIEINGKKIIGSAQKRIGSSFLQHGSIPLQEEKDLLKTVSLLQGSEEEIRITSLSRALGRKITFDWAVPFFIKGIAKTFGVVFQEKIWTEEEVKSIHKIRREKYGNDSWTFGS